MRKTGSKIIKQILSFLYKPYPFYYKGKTLWIIVSLLFLMNLFFEYIFEPFIVYVPEHKFNHFWISCIHGFVIALIISLISMLVISKNNKKGWKIYKEILLIASFLLFVGIAQFLIRDIIYNNPYNWSWKYLFEEIGHAYLVGTLFAAILISVNFNRINIKMKKNASSFKPPPNFPNPDTNSIIFIKTQLKGEEFELNVNDLLYAKADRNYLELFLKKGKNNKLLKRMTIKELESTLTQFKNIIKVHRSYIVNLNHIKNITGNAQGYKLQLINCKEKIPVSRNMIKNFNKRMNIV